MSTFVKGDRAGDKVGGYAFVHAENQLRGVVSLPAAYETKAGELGRHTCPCGEATFRNPVLAQRTEALPLARRDRTGHWRYGPRELARQLR